MAHKRPAAALRFDLGELAEDEAAAPAPEETPTMPEATERRAEGLRLARAALEGAAGALLAAAPDEESVAAGAASDTALSVAGFYERLRRALRLEFPDEVWVTGEIRKVTVSKGHRYLELADHDPLPPGGRPGGPPGGARAASLEVACWSRDWPYISARLEAVGLELAAGLVVRVRGRVSIWDAGARVRFSMSDLDVEALLGGIAAARRQLVAKLRDEGVLEANRRLAMPLVPLRIGLVTSSGSEAYRDFTGQLERSGLAFRTHLEASLVQGPGAPSKIAGALRRLQGRELDLIVLVRGGGAKGDLAAFDHEAVARAIVESRYPVWTGIGHTGDLSVADEVAQRALITPTACGEAVVDAVQRYLSGLDERSGRLAVLGRRALDRAAHAAASRRSDLARAARHELVSARAVLDGRHRRLEAAAGMALERASSSLGRRASSLASVGRHRLAVGEQELARQRAMLDAFDPRRQLERGWSLTRTTGGAIVRSVDALRPGDDVVTTLADGSFTATTRSIRRRTEDARADGAGE